MYATYKENMNYNQFCKNIVVDSYCEDLPK